MTGKIRYLAVIGLLALAQIVLADVNPPVYTQIKLQGQNGKVITLRLEKISSNEKLTLQQRAASLEKPSIQAKSAATPLPEVNLGMNGVPVLDQGVHGSCVTFSVTAAIDAALYGDDKISQLCVLELGQSLEQQNPYDKSGWDGASAQRIIERIEKYGVIDKSLESSIRCGGLKSYPRLYPWKGDAMSIEDYQRYSYPITESIKIERLRQSSQPEQNLEAIKQELKAGNRVLVGLYLDSSSLSLGFSGRYHTMAFGDTLVLTDGLKEKVKNGSYKQLGGHHMIIYGYNDDAEVDGQRGVFYLRNSWGAITGDYGDAYVTYNYFKVMLKSAEAVRVLH